MEQLQKLDVEIFDQTICERYLGKSFKRDFEICAGARAGGPINGQCRVRFVFQH